jgi:hypothetical protein
LPVDVGRIYLEIDIADEFQGGIGINGDLRMDDFLIALAPHVLEKPLASYPPHSGLKVQPSQEKFTPSRLVLW